MLIPNMDVSGRSFLGRKHVILAPVVLIPLTKEQCFKKPEDLVNISFGNYDLF